MLFAFGSHAGSPIYFVRRHHQFPSQDDLSGMKFEAVASDSPRQLAVRNLKKRLEL